MWPFRSNKAPKIHEPKPGMEYQYGSEYEEWLKQELAEREAREKRYAELRPDPSITRMVAQAALSGGHTHEPLAGNFALAMELEAQIAARQNLPEQRTSGL